MTKHEGITRRGQRWHVAIRIGPGRHFRGTFDTLAEARTARDKARDDARAGRAVLDARTSRITVGELAEAHFAAMAPRWSYRTRLTHAGEWRALEPVFGAIPVVALSPTKVADWLAAQTYAANTVAQRLGLLRAILDRAAIDLGIPNVARLVKRPRQKNGGLKRRRSFTPDQIAKVLGEVDDRYRIVVMLMLGLGLRSAEARGLTLDRVEVETGEVLIDRQLQRVRKGDDLPPGFVRVEGTGFAFGPPKTERAEEDQIVMAGGDVLDAIGDHVDAYGLGPAGLIVTGHRGQPLCPSQWTLEVDRIREATGVDLRGHDLRHTYGSWALDGGATIAEVASDLRHDVGTAVRTYLHAQRPADGARSDGVLGRATAAAALKPRARGHLKAV